jgi:hypothetical protein
MKLLGLWYKEECNGLYAAYLVVHKMLIRNSFAGLVYHSLPRRCQKLEALVRACTVLVD